MTFLEVVFAVALLGILAATLLGATNYLLARQKYEQRTLACMELANRIILQFLDDRDSPPDPADALNYGGDDYHWSLEESPVAFHPAKTQPVAEGRTPTSFDSFRIFKVRVWLATAGPATMGVPHAEISRMYDVNLMFRNPDSLENIIHSEGGVRRMLDGASNVPMGLRPKSGAGKSPTTGGGAKK